MTVCIEVRGLFAFPNNAENFNFFALGYMDYVHRLKMCIYYS